LGVVSGCSCARFDMDVIILFPMLAADEDNVVLKMSTILLGLFMLAHWKKLLSCRKFVSL
jgi:hypothetical protein